MIKILIATVAIFGLTACNANDKKEEDKDTQNQIRSNNFDMGKINFTENLNTISTAQGLKLSYDDRDVRT